MTTLREAAQQALEALETVLSDAYHRRFPECCGRPGSECCGNPNEAWAPEDNKIMDALSPVQRQLSDALRAALAEQPAEQEAVASECTDPMCACRGGPCAVCQDGEREKEVADLRASLDFYKRRADALQKAQQQMRDPERTIVCDILANGHLLDPAGGRYTAPQPAKQPLTREEILELAEPFGAFQYGDAQGHKRIDFANAIIAAYERKNGIGEQP